MVSLPGGYIINTHPAWLKNQIDHKDSRDSCVFWGKSPRLPSKTIQNGTCIFFRETQVKPYKIKAYGVVEETEILTLKDAWDKFGELLGYPSIEEIVQTSSKFTGDRRLESASEIYCIVVKDFNVSNINVDELSSMGIEYDAEHIVSGKAVSSEQTSALLKAIGRETGEERVAVVPNNIFIAPVSKEHFNRELISTIPEPDKLVSLEGLYTIPKIESTLSLEEKSRLRELYPDGKIRIWGTKPALKSTWESIRPGDLVIFYRKHYYIYYARIVFKTVNKDLARLIWPSEDEVTWEYVFFVENIERISIHRKDFNERAGYDENFVPQGFMKITPDRIERVMEMLRMGEPGEEVGQELKDYATACFLTFLIYKRMNGTAPNQIIDFMKEYNLYDNSTGKYWNPWMDKSYENESSATRTIDHFKQSRRYACWRGRDIKTDCDDIDCKYHPKNPEEILNKCDLDKGVVWKKDSYDSEYKFGEKYLEVLKNEILTENKIPLKLLLKQFYPHSEIGKDLAFQFKSEFNFSEREFNELFDVTDMAISTKRIPSIDEIISHIKAEGYYYPEETIKNYHISLKAKPFVILSGITGIGKTKLAELYANAFHDVDQENEYYKRIPVQPNWNDKKPLIGFYNSIMETYYKTPFLNFLLKANEDCQNCSLNLNGKCKDKSECTRKYFVCLDEMNLAHVEYYFADFLSAMESNRIIEIYSTEVKTDDGNDLGPKIMIPENLYIIGTVNIDETTKEFSPKVLDRANTIYLDVVDLDRWLEVQIVKGKIVDRDAFKVVKEIHDLLKKYEMHFGYRVCSEILEYIQNSILPKDRALDLQIMQKILPKLSGDDNVRLHGSLKNLKEYLVNTPYVQSGRKVTKMLDKLEEQGFTSFFD